VTTLAIAASEQAVKIVEPTVPVTAPLTEFKVTFSKFFSPGSFIAELDGQNITSGFKPAATPAGTAVLVLPDTGESLTGGTLVPQAQPPQRLPVAQLPPDIQFTPGAAPASPQPPPGAGSGTGSSQPTPNISLFTHTLKASGQCSGVICATTDEVQFFPVHLAALPGTIFLRVGETAQATVETYPWIATAVQVRVRPGNGAVRLNGQPPGTPITFFVLPKQQVRFTVTGANSGNIALFVEARGTQEGHISGAVNQ
jgi:hypothetical protein